MTSITPYTETLLFANLANTTLAGSINNTQTSIALTSGGGALFPSPSSGQGFTLTLIQANNPSVQEVTLCTHRSGDTLTVMRAQEGTSPQSFAANDIATNQCTAGTMATMLQQGQSPSFSPTSILYYGQDTSSAANQLIVTTDPEFEAYVDGMVIEIQPNGTTTSPAPNCNINGAGNVPLANAGGAALLNGQIIGGQKFLCFYDGTLNKLVLQAGPTTQVNTNVNFFLNASTGSDSNNGLSASSAFQTITGAVNAINANYQPNGPVTLNLANGLYAGGTINGSSVSSWIISGNSGNPNAVGIVANAGTGSGNNYGVGLIIQDAVVTVMNCTFVQGGQTSIHENVFVGSGAQVNLVNCGFGAPSGGSSSPRSTCIGVYAGSCSVYGNSTYNGLSNSSYAFATADNTGNLLMGYNYLGTASSWALAISGSPSHSAGFLICYGNGAVAADANTVSFTGGSCTGHTATIGVGGVVTIVNGGNPPSANFFPGNLGTNIDASTFGVYAGS